MAKARFLFLAAALLAAAAGCSGKSPVFADTVEGTLTLDGSPVPDALVQFVPDVPEGTKAPPSSGMTDANGAFRLTRADNQKPGALVGPHRVVIFPGRQAVSRDDQSGAGRGASPVPGVYSVAARTPLKVDVTREKTSYELRMSRAAR